MCDASSLLAVLAIRGLRWWRRTSRILNAAEGYLGGMDPPAPTLLCVEPLFDKAGDFGIVALCSRRG
jgi:hypothetical protein